MQFNVFIQLQLCFVMLLKVLFFNKALKQAGAELCQAQTDLEKTGILGTWIPRNICKLNHFEEHFGSLNVFFSVSCQKLYSMSTYSSKRVTITQTCMLYAELLHFEDVQNCSLCLYYWEWLRNALKSKFRIRGTSRTVINCKCKQNIKLNWNKTSPEQTAFFAEENSINSFIGKPKRK